MTLLAAGTTGAVRAFQAALAVFMGLHLTENRWPNSTTVTNGDTFDFIIVGAGSAGSVVASRLTEMENYNVLLVDAGGDPPLESILPGAFVTLPNSVYDNNFVTKNNNYTFQNSRDDIAYLTSGKMLGGTSSLNHMSHMRGNVHDYELWAEATGDDSWNYENLLKYFIKSEKVEDEITLQSEGVEYLGTNGSMRMKREPSSDNDPIFSAFKELGYDKIINYNTPGFKLGIFEPLLYIVDGTRQGAAESYLRPIAKRPNFNLLKNTYVTKVLFDDDKNAIGVEALTSNGKTIKLYANNEVIISAGVFSSPKLLMLSGVGPGEHLKSLDIEVVSDIPVGQNFQEHAPVVVVTKMQEGLPSLAPLDLRKFPVPETIGYSALNKSQNYPDYQTINLIFTPDSIALIPICTVVLSYNVELCQKLYDEALGRATLVTGHSLIYPTSKGRVLLKSANPKDAPIIESGVLSIEQDLHNMALYLQDFGAIVNTTAFKKFNAEFVDFGLTECDSFVKYSYDYWRCYAVSMSTSLWQYTSTCAMGSVLDSKLNVNGVQKLRVVDASSMPNTISANPNAAIVALAEKASDLIKETYKGTDEE